MALSHQSLLVYHLTLPPYIARKLFYGKEHLVSQISSHLCNKSDNPTLSSIAVIKITDTIHIKYLGMICILIAITIF